MLCVREIARLITKPGENPNSIIFQEHFSDVPSVLKAEELALQKRKSDLKKLDGDESEPAAHATQVYERKNPIGAAASQEEESKARRNVDTCV